MKPGTVERSFFQRLLGRPATEPPQQPACWQYEDGVLTIDLQQAPELAEPGGAMRLEGEPLPHRVLVFRDPDGAYHAVHNRCTHAGRRLDPVPGTTHMQCCSFGKSTFDADGNVVSGSTDAPIAAYPVAVENGRLAVTVPAAV